MSLGEVGSMKSIRKQICRSRGVQRILGGLAAAVLVLFASAPVAAEIYKWKDSAGRLHFSQDLGQVPAQYRAQAKGSAMEEGAGGVIQRYQALPAAVSPRPSRSRAGGADPSAKSYRIRVQKTGGSMRVVVRLNDRVNAPFYIDTGASDVSLPEWVAKELGLDVVSARTALYSTANGTVESALVTLESVELGGARVENVPAHINKSMTVGLLGLSFFNHFRYRFDPASGIVSLTPNGLAESGTIKGGRSRDQWRAQFLRLAGRATSIERTLDEINPNWTVRKAELEAELDEVDRQVKLLDDEADDARVPMRWRF